jgi:hypothetical protein
MYIRVRVRSPPGADMHNGVHFLRAVRGRLFLLRPFTFQPLALQTLDLQPLSH